MSDGDTHRSNFLRTCLERLGDPRNFHKWETGEVNYVATLELTAGDVPELLTIARKWAEPLNWPDDDEYVAGYAPIHAWRALAQLGATEAIPVLLEMVGPLDERADDWYLEEFPHAFAWIGPASLPALADRLADTRCPTYPRVSAASGLRELAKRHPETRQDVVDVLRRTLSGFEHEDQEVSAFIITDLLDLKATEAAELIERAYAADCVAIEIADNWNTVRKELGVAGLGLVPKELAGATWEWGFHAPGRRHDQGILPSSGQYKSVSDDMVDAAVPASSSTRIGRNQPCPCGSGKKYKKCCGR